MYSEKLRKYAALGVIGLLGIFLAYALIPYLKSFFAALILYTLFKPLFRRLLNRGIGRRISAAITILVTILIIIIPTGLLSTAIIHEIKSIDSTRADFVNLGMRFNDITGLEIEFDRIASSFSADLKSWLTDQFPNIIGGIGGITVSILIMYFVFYYLLISYNTRWVTMKEFLPFNGKNSRRLIEELRAVTNSTVVGMGIIALVQGLLVGVLFLIFGLGGALFWGFVSAVLSFLPVVGAPLVWVPAGVIQILEGNVLAGIIILAVGTLIIGNVDNVLRPVIARKMANLHPLITLIGVFIGLSFFGIIGLIIGPLLLSYFFLMIKMFREEYMPARHSGKKIP